MYVNIRVLKCLKLFWAIGKRLQVISNKMLFKIVIPLRTKDKAVLILKQYCMHCYVTLSNIF